MSIDLKKMAETWLVMNHTYATGRLDIDLVPFARAVTESVLDEVRQRLLCMSDRDVIDKFKHDLMGPQKEERRMNDLSHSCSGGGCLICAGIRDIATLTTERDALKTEVMALKKDDFDTLRIVESENDFLKIKVTWLRETLEFALRGNNLSMNEAARLRRVLAETGSKEAI